VDVPHADLTNGSSCPSCTLCATESKLRPDAPRVIVCLTSGPLINGARYSLTSYRCTVCGERFEASEPLAAQGGKYSVSCKSQLAVARYGMGLPFKRIEQWQAYQGVPLADATQWDLVKSLYDVVSPVVASLFQQAASGEMVYYDDTPNRLLIAPETATRKGVYTTAMVSNVEAHRIFLYVTSHRHAGENIKSLLSLRDESADSLITMSDASAQNIPTVDSETLLSRWIFCFCLVHSRRKFFEVMDFFESQCDFVLEMFAMVYKHERHCHEEGYDAQARLSYHQTYSAAYMDKLYTWCQNQLLYQQTEPNSGLGEAIRYLLKHWEGLTQFLRVAGAPLDNSLCERAIKVAIRHRRNSLFYRTQFGADVGDGLMSLIQTACHHGIDPVHYLNSLQQHADGVRGSPSDWLPWCYQKTLSASATEKEPLAA